MTTQPEVGNNISQATAADAGTSYWPEEIRSQPHANRFPWTAPIFGLLPGVLAVVLLSVLLIWLRNQANHQIVFVNANGQLNAIQANRENRQSISDSPLQLNSTMQGALENDLPVFGLPQWSPDGHQLATTIAVGTGIQAAVFSPANGHVTLLPSHTSTNNKTAFPGNGWSPTGTHIAVLESDGQRPFLNLVDLTQEEPIITSTNQTLDTRAGFAWHPNGEQVLATVLSDDVSLPSLRTIGLDGLPQVFAPNDGSQLRADAVWISATNSLSVAYIAVDPVELQQTGYLAGSLWVSDSDGNNARQIVEEGLNLAPIWTEDDPNFIYFTRYMTNTNSFDLYRVRISGLPGEQRVGGSSQIMLDYPFDRQRFLRWSEDSESLEITTTPQPSVNEQGRTAEWLVRSLIQNSLPMLAIPQWSPDGRHLVTTNWRDGKIQPTIYDENLQTGSTLDSVLDVMAVPTDGWSADGSTLAAVEHDGVRALLTLVLEPFSDETAIPYDLTLDTRAGMDWHPQSNRLLITAYSDDAPEPGLFTVESSSQPGSFMPDDSHRWRADGSWSPDGSQVAYIAGDVYTTSQDILPGELWIAGSDGSNPRRLVEDAQAIAPVWNATGDTIYYTRFNDKAGPFALYQVAADGSTPPEYVGPGSEAILLYPWDRSLLLQWSPDGKQLLFVGETPPPPPWYLTNAPDNDVVSQIQADLPVMGVSQWAPDGQQFAGTVLDEQAVRVAFFKSPTGPPILTSPSTDTIAMPTDGWSPDSSYLALLRYDGSVTRLTVMDTVQSSLANSTFTLDTRAGLSWHPGSDRVMFTALEEGITPTLGIFNIVENASRLFAPEDDQIVHADGVWSPDGRQVVYVAHETLTETLEMEYLAGPLWISGSNGRDARQLVPDGLNFAPMWDLAHERILFTRFVTETETFDLFQVDLAGETVEQLGPSTSFLAQFPFDRQHFLRWSPEGIRWLLPGGEGALPFIYYQRDGNAAIDSLDIGCTAVDPFTVRWAPTGRGVLVGCPTGGVFLHWTDRERDNKEYADGLHPAWQP